MKLYGIKIWYKEEAMYEIIADQLFFEEESERDKFFDSLPFPLSFEGCDFQKYDRFGYNYYTKEDYETETKESASEKLKDIIETYEAKKKEHGEFMARCRKIDYLCSQMVSSGTISIEGV